jgi:hypothetical protein
MGAAGSSARYRSRYSEADAIAACDGQPYDFDEAKWSRVPKGSDGRADLVDILSSLCEGRSVHFTRKLWAAPQKPALAPIAARPIEVRPAPVAVAAAVPARAVAPVAAVPIAAPAVAFRPPTTLARPRTCFGDRAAAAAPPRPTTSELPGRRFHAPRRADPLLRLQAEKVRSEAARERSGAHAPPLGALGWWAPRKAVAPKALRLPDGAAVAAADCRRGSVAGAVDGVLTLAECGAFVEAARRRGFSRARYEAKQRMSKVVVEDGRCAASLWERCRRHLPRFWEAPDGSAWRAVGINSHMRVLRYEAGDAFDAHRDAAFARRGLASFVTVQIYLNDGGRDFDGGETRFVGKDRRGAPEDYEDVVPRVGRLLYFDHDLLHEGRLVTRGVKYAIRTELMFEPDT